MPTKSVPKLLQEAGQIKEALEKIGSDLPGGVSAKEVSARIDALNGAVSKLDALNAEKKKLVNTKDQQCKTLSDFIVKARLAIKLAYGPDSSEYEMAGGTRASERKRPVRKAKESK
jgi:hypothetical protein